MACESLQQYRSLNKTEKSYQISDAHFSDETPRLLCTETNRILKQNIDRNLEVDLGLIHYLVSLPADGCLLCNFPILYYGLSTCNPAVFLFHEVMRAYVHCMAVTAISCICLFIGWLRWLYCGVLYIVTSRHHSSQEDNFPLGQ